MTFTVKLDGYAITGSEIQIFLLNSFMMMLPD